MRVLVTGASGFVGTRLVQFLAQRGHAVTGVVRATSRADTALQGPGIALVAIEDVSREHDWASKLAGVDAVVHLAARVHLMRDVSADPLASFRQVNVEGTRRLAEAALAAGVRRFVYLSSIKVNGERTSDRPFRADDVPAPCDPYAVSKLEAEQCLWSLAGQGRTEFVVIRPPLVYGPGVKGNLARLMRAVQRGWPLPLGALNQPRSMVSVDNLVDLVEACLLHPDAAGEVFLAADAADWSTARLVSLIAAEMGRPCRSFRLPPGLLRTGGRLLGLAAEVDRLCDPLQVDIRKNRERLQWEPPHAGTVALAAAVRAFQRQIA